MRSSGFGLGKKQPREESKKKPPTNADLTQLLGQSQKNVDRTYTYNWQTPDQPKLYFLSVITHGAGKNDQRRGWAVSAHENSAIGAADWTLQCETEGRRQQLFNMQSSDSYMVQSVIEEILAEGADPAATVPLDEQWGAVASTSEATTDSGAPPAYGGAPSYGGAPENSAPTPPAYGGAPADSHPTTSYGESNSSNYGGSNTSNYGGSNHSNPGGGNSSSYGGAGTVSSYGGASNSTSPSGAGTTGGAGVQEAGNLRSTSIRALLEGYVANQSTGRLIVDQATVTSEVFFAEGKPTHAKSIHSIYRDRDMTGDSVVVDLLTWTEGDYKFQNGYPAATRTVYSSMDDLLAGRVSAAAPSSDVSSSAHGQTALSGSSGSFTTESSVQPAGAKLPGTAAPPIPLAAKLKVDPDDFSNADDLIGETFSNLIEPSGMLKYGMFLMLARTEFARFEMTRLPFCVAAIGLESQGVLSYESIAKVQECFEAAGQPLDTISAATGVRFFALFPHCAGTTAAQTMKQFINNLQNTALSQLVHGSALRISVGICEVPRDGSDFEAVMNKACKMRLSATPERRIVMNVG